MGACPPSIIMSIDQNKLIALVLEKNTKKISDLQSQVIILESQLELMTEINKQLQEQVDKIKKKESKTEFQN